MTHIGDCEERDFFSDLSRAPTMPSRRRHAIVSTRPAQEARASGRLRRLTRPIVQEQRVVGRSRPEIRLRVDLLG